jgi:hypothetical protein
MNPARHQPRGAMNTPSAAIYVAITCVPGTAVHSIRAGRIDQNGPRVAPPRSPCRPRCRNPAPAGRWWFPHRACIRTGDARRLAAPLAELPDVVQREPVATQVVQAVEQRRSVSGREHETVAVGSARVVRVVFQSARPQRIGHRAAPRGRPGWPLLAFCTMFTDRKRRVLMHRWSSDVVTVTMRLRHVAGPASVRRFSMQCGPAARSRTWRKIAHLRAGV